MKPAATESRLVMLQLEPKRSKIETRIMKVQRQWHKPLIKDMGNPRTVFLSRQHVAVWKGRVAAHSHDVRLVGRCEAPNLFIRIKKSANHSIFLTLSPMRTMKVEQVQKLIFFTKCKDIIGLI